MTADQTPPKPTLADIEAAGARRKRDELRAKKSSADLKELVVAALRASEDTVTDITNASGWTAAYVRKLARENDIPVDPRYRSRAELLRARMSAEPPTA